MGLTTIDLRINGPFATSRPFDPTQVSSFVFGPAPTSLIRIPPPTGNYATFQSVPWVIARVHLREVLGLPFRCDVFLTRTENFRPDPSIPRPVETIFDRAGDLIDDDDDTPGGEDADDLKSITDQFDGGKTGGGGAPAWGNLWNVPNAANQASDAIGDWWAAEQQADPFSNWQQQLLGIPPDELFQEDPAPNPGLFVDRLSSVLIRRVAADGTELGRWITGLCTEFEDLGPITDRRRMIRLRLEPQLARLQLRRDHRMFDEGQSAVDVLVSLFKDAEIYPGFVPPLYPCAKRERVVQYGETDLELALRLISEEGWIPIFESHMGAERLQLVRPEECNVLGPGPAQEFVAMDANDVPMPQLDFGAGPTNREGLFGFTVKRSIGPVGARMRSTNFSVSYNASTELPTHVQEGTYEIPDRPIEKDIVKDKVELTLERYPARTALLFDGGAANQADAVDLNDEAMFETRAARVATLIGSGRTNAVGLMAGQVVPVTDALSSLPIYEPDVVPFGRPFLVTQLETLADDTTALGTLGTLNDLPVRPDGFLPTAAIPFESIVQMVPQDGVYAVQYLPPRLRHPGIDGVQTSVVRAGVFPYEEGHSRLGADSVGRVRGSLHWDRREKTSNNELPLSPPIRIGGPWAGHAWGSTFLPREGMELVIAFMHGDPEQPIALGGVHGLMNPAPTERPHIRFVEDVNHLGELTEDELEELKEREEKEDEEEEETSEGEEKKEKKFNDSITVDKRLHYKPDLPIKNTTDRFINMIRTQVHPAPKERPRAYHEISFDDTPEKERLRIHSDGFLEETVKNDHRVLVGRDQTNIVQGKQVEEIAKDQTLIVSGHRTKIVTGNEQEVVEKLQEIKVVGSKSLEVHKNQIRNIGTAKAATKEVLHVGDAPGAAVARELRSHHDRKTAIEGDDTRTVGGDVMGRIKGTYELAGAPLNIQAQSGAGMESTADGTMKINGDKGIAEIVAKGAVNLAAKEMNFEAAKTIRFEVAEDLFLELSESEIFWKAPGGFYVDLHGGPMANSSGAATPSVEAHIALDLKKSKEIVFTLEAPDPDDDESNGAHKFRAVMRAGTKTTTYLDALEGDPGIAIDPVDVFVIKGGYGAFKCRHVEVQDGSGKRDTFRQKTPAEKKLLKEIAELIAERGRMIKRRKEAGEERDEAQQQYKDQGDWRKMFESDLKGTEGTEEDVNDAMDDLADDRDELYLAKRRVTQLEMQLERAKKRKEQTGEIEEDLKEAREDLASEQEDYDEAEKEFHDDVESKNEEAEQNYINACELERQADEKYRARVEEVEQLTADIHELDGKIEAKKAEALELELDMEEIKEMEEQAVA